METEKEKKARRERYDHGNDHWQRGGTTGPVRILEAFGAIAVRHGDPHSKVRGVEAVRPGDVVELRIHPEPNSNQSREQVASWYAKQMFELAPDEALTPFEDAPTRAPDPDAVDAPATRIARLEAHIERLEQRLEKAEGKAAAKK